MSKNASKYNCFVKYQNLCKVFYGYIVSSITGKSHFYGMPYAASVEPANFCNLRCPQCPTGLGVINKQKVLMDIQRFQSIIDSLSPELMWINLYFQGEPFLNKQLPKMVEYANSNGIYTSISTNGHFLTKETTDSLKQAGLWKLIVSLDGVTEESYKKYRIGGNFNKVIEGIKNAVESGIRVELQCLLLSSTESEIAQIKSLGKQLGVWKTTFKTAQFYNNDDLMPKNNGFSRYKNGTLTLKKRLRNRCWRVFSSIVITADGEIVPCCFDKECIHSYGNIYKTGINKDAFCKLLNSQKASDFRNSVLKNRKCIDICTNCNE